MQVVGLLPLAALLSNNLASTQLGDPTAPFVLAGIGYPGLAILAVAFIMRFVRAHEGASARAAESAAGGS